MLVAARCTPGQSWYNTAKRIMSLLNIALQNCALERKASSEDTERMNLTRCSLSASVRAESDRPELVREWGQAVNKLKEKVGSRFSRMSLKEKPVVVEKSVEAEEIDP